MTGIRELLLTVALGACASSDVASGPIAHSPAMTPPWPGILSSAVAAPPGTDVAEGWRGTVAYVSARPTTFDDATRVFIYTPRYAHEIVLAFVDSGGFDPRPVPALAGDTLRVEVVHAVGQSSWYLLMVPLASEPSVVRAHPGPGAVEVPLNAQISVVFSEPVTVGQETLRLLKDGVAVAGSVALSKTGTSLVEFLPFSTLSAGTSYDLDVPSPVTGQHGSLMTPWRSRFTTQAAPERADLAIDSFSMIEFQYSDDPSGVWYYAPQIRVRETTTRGGLRITKLKFSTDTWTLCVSGLSLSPGQTRDVFREVYGDYQLTMAAPNGAKWTTRQVTLTVSYVDDTGRAPTVTAVGPVVPGALPTTYTGGVPSTTVRPCQ